MEFFGQLVQFVMLTIYVAYSLRSMQSIIHADDNSTLSNVVTWNLPRKLYRIQSVYSAPKPLFN